jgi:hypothetical protein
MLVITTFSITVSAGYEDEPEIVDDENDMEGSLVRFPILYKIFQKIGIVPIQSFEFMDIKSASFFEEEAEPDFLFASINLKDLEYTPLRTIYAIRWTFEEKNYAAGGHIHSNGEFSWFFAGRICGLFDNWAYKKGLIIDISDCEIDLDNNYIKLKIPKDIIGDPQPGEILKKTNAWTGLRFICEILTYPFGGELVRDPTAYGKEYTIKY